MEKNKIESLLNEIYKNQGYLKQNDPSDCDHYLGFSQVLELPWTSDYPSVRIIYLYEDEENDRLLIIVTPTWEFELGYGHNEDIIIKDKLINILEDLKIPGELLYEKYNRHEVRIKYGKEEGL